VKFRSAILRIEEYLKEKDETRARLPCVLMIPENAKEVEANKKHLKTCKARHFFTPRYGTGNPMIGPYSTTFSKKKRRF